MDTRAHSEPGIPDWPCHINGAVSTLDQARVSVLDRGFIFGDGVYEVLPVYAGRIFCFGQHMDRLDRSLREMRMRNPHAPQAWLAMARELIDAMQARGHADLLVYLQITRGVALRDHVMPTDLVPTVFMMVTPMKPPTPEQRTRGVACLSADDFRWQKAHIKATSLLGAVFARQLSADAGLAETILFRDGHLSEASSSNVWVVRDGCVMGPPASHLVLEGIRFGLVERLCRTLGIPFELRHVARHEVSDADELLLSSATKEVLPVTLLDDRPIGRGNGAGQPGPVYRRLYEAYQGLKATESI
ncbi:MAG: aminotransferase class IV [Burkholderiaceae bacterium]